MRRRKRYSFICKALQSIKLRSGLFFNLLFSDLVTFWSRYELIVKKQWKRKSNAKKYFLSIASYKGRNSQLGSIIKSVFIAWARNGHVLVTVLILRLLSR